MKWYYGVHVGPKEVQTLVAQFGYDRLAGSDFSKMLGRVAGSASWKSGVQGLKEIAGPYAAEYARDSAVRNPLFLYASAILFKDPDKAIALMADLDGVGLRSEFLSIPETREAVEYAVKKLARDYGRQPMKLVAYAEALPRLKELISRRSVGNIAEFVAERLSASSPDWNGLEKLVETFDPPWEMVLETRRNTDFFLEPSQDGGIPQRAREVISLFQLSREQVVGTLEWKIREAVRNAANRPLLEFSWLKGEYELTEAEAERLNPARIGRAMLEAQFSSGSASEAIALAEALSASLGASFSESIRTEEWKRRAEAAFLEMVEYAFGRVPGLAVFGLDSDWMREQAAAWYVDAMRSGSSAGFEAIRENFGLDVELATDEAAAARREGMANRLEYRFVNALRFYRETGGSPGAYAQDADMRRRVAEAAARRMNEFVTELNPAEQDDLLSLAGLAKDLFEETWPAARRRKNLEDAQFDFSLLRNYTHSFPRLQEESWVLDGVRSRVEGVLQGGDVSYAITDLRRELNDLPFSADLYRTDELAAKAQSAAGELLLSEDDWASVEWLRSFFDVDLTDGVSKSLQASRRGPLYRLDRLLDAPGAERLARSLRVGEAVDRVIDHDPDTRRKIGNFYASRRRYEGLRMAHRLGAALFPFREEEEAGKELDRLWRGKDVLAAEGFVACMEEVGMRVDAEKKREIAEAAKEERASRERREELRVPDAETHEVTATVAEFYLDEWIGREMASLQSKAGERGNPLSFKSRVGLFDLAGSLERRTERELVWIREYLVKAVFGELRHQEEIPLSDEGDVSIPEDIDVWLRTATEEEIRQRMLEARVRFEEDGWNMSYGGKAWARIAEAAEQMWTPNRAARPLIDHAFDLEHNTGTVFNKDSQRVIYQHGALKKMLDLKLVVNSPEAYLPLVRAHAGEDVYDDLKTRWDGWTDLRDRALREATSAGADPAREREASLLAGLRDAVLAPPPDAEPMRKAVENLSDDELESFLWTRIKQGEKEVERRTEAQKLILAAVKRGIARYVPDTEEDPAEFVRSGDGMHRRALLRELIPLYAALYEQRNAVERLYAENEAAADVLRRRRPSNFVVTPQRLDSRLDRDHENIVAAILERAG